MTANQTIDGVPLAELKFDDRLFHVSKTWKSCGRGWVNFICDEGDGCVRVRCENGAVPIVKLCNLQTLAVTDEQELAEFYNELSNGDALARRALTHIKALHLANKPAAQPQCVTVHMVRSHGSNCWEEMSGESLEMCQVQPGEYEVRKLYAEQPAPVEVVLPERPYASEDDHETMTDYEIGLGHGACEMWDKIKALNSTRPTHANPPPGTEPSGTHHDNDGLDEWRKPACCGSCPGGCVIGAKP